MRTLILSPLLFGFTFTAMAAGAGTTAKALRSDFRENPLGIVDSRPRLSWTIASGQRGTVQSAYRVMAATSRTLLETEEPDLWDSGKVESSGMHARYAGKPLQSAQAVCWRVRVWDGGGQVSVWSDAATWTMGLLEPPDWQAEWIAGRAQRPVLEGAQ